MIKNYKNYFRSRFLPARIVKDLTIEQLSKLEEQKNYLSGIVYKQFPERIYHPEVKATHILGYLKEVDSDMRTDETGSPAYQSVSLHRERTPEVIA